MKLFNTKMPRPLLVLSLVLLTLGLYSCDISGGSGGTGTLKVQMTDAPANYDAVIVDIQSVRVNMNAQAMNNSASGDSSNGWVTIMNDPQQVNLLDLRNGNEITLGDTELEAGTYSQLRLVLGTNNKVIIDGLPNILKTPSGQQSGLKLDIDAKVESGTTYTLLLDFDASRSIVKTGSEKFILKPVIRAVNLSETGSISGTVSPSSFETSVRAIAEGDTLSTLTNGDGDFMIQGVAPGTYNVQFVPGDDQYTETTTTGVSVSKEEETDMGTVKLEQ